MSHLTDVSEELEGRGTTFQDGCSTERFNQVSGRFQFTPIACPSRLEAEAPAKFFFILYFGWLRNLTKLVDVLGLSL